MINAQTERVRLVACAALLGEGPVWVAREGALYWVDIKGPAIFRWTEATGSTQYWTPPFRVGSLAPRAAGGFVAGTEHGFAIVDPDADRYELLHDPEPEFPRNRFNDGKLDRHGRFWAGTMDDDQVHARGALYRLDPDLGSTRIDEGYQVTNGPAFDRDGTTMFHNDSAARTIYAFDLAPDGGAHGKREFARFAEHEGYPDGMTVDAEGCLWVACWDAWCVRRFAPDGTRQGEVRLPVERPTSCAFGGAQLERLFVTSARIGLDDAALARQPAAGDLFALDVGVRGIADTLFGQARP